MDGDVLDADVVAVVVICVPLVRVVILVEECVGRSECSVVSAECDPDVPVEVELCDIGKLTVSVCCADTLWVAVNSCPPVVVVI